jgi:hypothetical protein
LQLVLTVCHVSEVKVSTSANSRQHIHPRDGIPLSRLNRRQRHPPRTFSPWYTRPAPCAAPLETDGVASLPRSTGSGASGEKTIHSKKSRDWTCFQHQTSCTATGDTPHFWRAGIKTKWKVCADPQKSGVSPGAAVHCFVGTVIR